MLQIGIKSYSTFTPKNLPLFNQFVNNLLKDGKKATAERLLNQSINTLRLKYPNDSPFDLFTQAISLASPLVRLSSSKRGAKNLLSPRPLTERQRQRTGILWIIEQSAKNKSKGISIGEKIGLELCSVLQGSSPVLQKKMMLHKQAIQNRSNVIMVDRNIIKY